MRAQQVQPSASNSNMGGWQSGPDLSPGRMAGLPLRAASGLRSTFTSLVATAPAFFRGWHDLSGWGAINRKGHYNAEFTSIPWGHGRGVYYVDPGDDERGAIRVGVSEFAHPVPAAASVIFSERAAVGPAGEAGSRDDHSLPSYLYHSVRMYEGSRPRICVPFNAHLKNGSRVEPSRASEPSSCKRYCVGVQPKRRLKASRLKVERSSKPHL